ncbi:MAG: rod shape-determining protein RodA [Patescibacteria group bacterium]|nr:rod shape-determining protein RodA [Patescibacteria group bacterium]
MNFSFKIDWRIIIPAFFLYALGVTTLYSVAPNLVNEELFFGFLGFLVFFLFAAVDYRIYKNLTPWFYVLSIFFLILTEVVGVVTRGSVRWLDIGLIRLQPSELIKPLMILFLADRFEAAGNYKNIIISSLLFFFPVILILRQPDLGNALVFGFLWLTIFFVSGVKPLLIAICCFVFLALAIPVWHFLKEYQKQRIITFLNPGIDPLGTGYNAIQSMLAVGSGELFGRGLGRGTQSHLAFLPEFHTDFIFASFAEEWGFIGVCVLLSAYCYLLFRLFSQMQNTKENFGRIVLVGVISVIFIQMFINIGMNMSLVPITGITLPLVSYGGSSLISTAILLGIASNIISQNSHRKIISLS